MVLARPTLLATMADQARRNDWVVVEVEAQTSQEVAGALRRRISKDVTRALRRRKFSRSIVDRLRLMTEEFSVSATAFGTGVSVSKAAPTPQASLGVEFEDLVEELCDELRTEGNAFGVFVDEMQELEAPLLQVLLATQHRAAQRGWPFFLVGAGLPNLPQVLADARSLRGTAIRLPHHRAGLQRRGAGGDRRANLSAGASCHRRGC